METLSSEHELIRIRIRIRLYPNCLIQRLFTKFPQYLSFFPSFSELDLDDMHENKRLMKHATKVIDTVTFVVDSVGDEAKSNQLNEALVQLVKSHLRRGVGTPEFRNLGVVLIDFICDVNSRRGAGVRSKLNQTCAYTLPRDDKPSGQTLEPILDTNSLVDAWTRLYGVILDLVKEEEAASAVVIGTQSS